MSIIQVGKGGEGSLSEKWGAWCSRTWTWGRVHIFSELPHYNYFFIFYESPTKLAQDWLCSLILLWSSSRSRSPHCPKSASPYRFDVHADEAWGLQVNCLIDVVHGVPVDESLEEVFLVDDDAGGVLRGMGGAVAQMAFSGCVHFLGVPYSVRRILWNWRFLS